MIDLHSHILPCIDDGPDSVDESVELIKMELAGGVDTIAVTPHFIPEKEYSIDYFCRKRRNSADFLERALLYSGVKIKIAEAAEVALRRELPEKDELERLKYAGTDYMLIELPHEYYFDWIEQTLYRLRLAGVIPVLAHVERYDYILKNPEILYRLVSEGCLAQINAGFILKGGYAQNKRVTLLVRRNLIHIIATDTHSVLHRPPQLKAAMKLAGKKWGRDTQLYFCENAGAVMGNRLPELLTPLPALKRFGLF